MDNGLTLKQPAATAHACLGLTLTEASAGLSAILRWRCSNYGIQLYKWLSLMHFVLRQDEVGCA